MRNNCACGEKSRNGGLYTLSVLKVNPGSNPYEDEEHRYTCGKTKKKEKLPSVRHNQYTVES